MQADFWSLADHRGDAPLRIGARMTSFDSFFEVVSAGLAVGVCPASAAETLAPAFPACGSCRSPGAPCTVAVAWPTASETPAVRAFVQTSLAAPRRRLTPGRRQSTPDRCFTGGAEAARGGHAHPHASRPARGLRRQHSSPGTRETDELALAVVVARAGGEPALHVHDREDETYVVLEGELTFQRGDERFDAAAGDVVFLPRGVVHGFALRTPSRAAAARLHAGRARARLSTRSPSRERTGGAAATGPPTPEQINAMEVAFGAYGVTFTGPPLPVLLGSEAA